MKHRGEILKKAIEASGIAVSKIGTKSKISRATIYRAFDDPFCSLDYIIRIGRVIEHDFAKEIPELSDPNRLDSEENLNYKIKYYQLLEDYTALLKERLEQYEVKKKK